MAKVITNICKRGDSLRIVLTGNQIRNRIRNRIRNQIRECLPDGMELDDEQRYMFISFRDDHLQTREWSENETIELDLEPGDFQKKNGMISLKRWVKNSKCNYIEYGSGEEKHIAANVYYMFLGLRRHVQNKLDEGMLYSYILSDKKFNFTRDRVQDDPAVRYATLESNNYYILRHFLAYTTIYYEMFSSFFKKVDIPDKSSLTILSIGCGCKTDALALRVASRDYAERVPCCQYVGVDFGCWDESEFFFHFRDDDKYIKVSSIDEEIRYIENRLMGEFHRNEENAASEINLIVFPNSISEICVEDLSRLFESIQHVYAGKTVYLLLSKNREFETGRPIDQEQIDFIETLFRGKYNYVVNVTETNETTFAELLPEEEDYLLDSTDYDEMSYVTEEIDEDDLDKYSDYLKGLEEEQEELDRQRRNREEIERKEKKSRNLGIDVGRGTMSLYKEIWTDDDEEWEKWIRKTIEYNESRGIDRGEVEQSINYRKREIEQSDKKQYMLKYPILNINAYESYIIYEVTIE